MRREKRRSFFCFNLSLIYNLRLLLLVGTSGHLVGLVQAACLANPVETPDRPLTVVIDEGNWDAAYLNTIVAKILLEDVKGWTVIVNEFEGPEIYDWEGLASGRVDAVLEVWAEGWESVIQEYVNSLAVSFAGNLGVVARNGWYMPKYAIDEREAYASYRPFARCEETLPLDTAATTGTLGEMSAISPEWILSRGTEQVVENNGLCLEVVYDSEQAVLQKWDDRVLAREPFLFTYWEPTMVLERYKFAGEDYRLERVQLPRWTQECQDAWQNGYNCDFPPALIEKYISGRDDMDAELRHFFQSFTMRNGDQEGMLAELAFTSAGMEEVACRWVTEHRHVWKDWFFQCPSNCFGQGVCNNGTCICLEGFTGEFCETKISIEYFLCGNETYFYDETGTLIPPDLTDDPAFVLGELVCDEIFDCDNWADEPWDCNPMIRLVNVIFCVIAGLTICAFGASFLFLFALRQRGRVRAAGMLFVGQMTLGCSWGVSAVFLFMGKASDVKCGMVPWFLSLSSALVIGSLVAKQYKVWKLFNHKGFGALIIGYRTLVGITLAIISVDFIVLVVWSAVDIPRLGVRKVDGELHPMCDADHALIWILVLVVYKFFTVGISAILAWKSRHVPSAYSEAKHIGFALYNAVFLLLVFTPIIFASATDQALMHFILIVTGIYLWFTSIYVTVIGYIIWGIYSERKESNDVKNRLPDFSRTNSSSTPATTLNTTTKN